MRKLTQSIGYVGSTNIGPLRKNIGGIYPSLIHLVTSEKITV